MQVDLLAVEPLLLVLDLPPPAPFPFFLLVLALLVLAPAPILVLLALFVVNMIPAIRVFDGARGRFSFSFTSKNNVIISIEKSNDNRNDNRQNVLSI